MRASTAAATKPVRAGVNYLELTFALLGGALVWLVRLVINSSLVTYSCQIGATWPLWLTSGVSALVAAAALAVAWLYYRAPDGGTARWLGMLGVMLNVTAIAGILLESVPIAVLNVCRDVVRG